VAEGMNGNRNLLMGLWFRIKGVLVKESF
jgi:hypothetical protein